MTATTTPRMGLIQPGSSDTFDLTEIDATFGAIDAHPGIMPVANYAALPTGLATAQHGMLFLTIDTRALWMWNKPGSGAGTWLRANSVGRLVRQTQSSSISTSATTSAAAPTTINTTFTAPGGRDIAVAFFATALTNDGSHGLSTVMLQVNGVDTESARTGAISSYYDSANLFYTITAPAPGTSINLKIKAYASQNGTTSMGFSSLYAWEQ